MNQEIFVPPMSAKAFSVTVGKIIRIVDVEGGQPGDLVAFKSDDFSVKLSQIRTRVENGRVNVGKGHQIWTNRFPPEILLRIIQDDFGSHDLLYPPCCLYALEKRFGVSRNGCLENLVEALKPWKVAPYEIPDPLNLFFSVAVSSDGNMSVKKPHSMAGCAIELQTEMNCVLAVSTCSVPFEGKKNSGFKIIIRDV